MLSETQDLLEETSSQLRSTEMELELANEQGDHFGDLQTSAMSLSEELERSLSADSAGAHESPSRRASGRSSSVHGEAALLKTEVDQLCAQISVVRDERDDAMSRLETARDEWHDERTDMQQQIRLLELQLAELQETFDAATANIPRPGPTQGDEDSESAEAIAAHGRKKKGMTLAEQTALFKVGPYPESTHTPCPSVTFILCQ